MTAAFLDQLLGEWTYEGHSVPDDPPHRRTGTETVSRRGAWVVLEGEDYRFQLAFNPETGRVVGDFIHRDDPTLWTYDGKVEADGKLHLKCRGPSLDGSETLADYDDVFDAPSQDRRQQTSRVQDSDGQWRDFNVISYIRKA